MATQTSVVACSSCGALYSPVPGDEGICAVCSPFLPSEPSARAIGTNPVQTPVKPLAPALKRSGVRSAERPHFRVSRRLQRLAMSAAAALLLAGGAAFLTTRGHSLEARWTALRRHTLPQAWAAIERQASDAWVAVRRRLPLDEPPPPSRSSVHESTASRSTHRRGQTPAVAKKKAKRSRDDFSGPGNTP